ncbi:MAG: transcriptional regulator, Crp/Fnr family [Candidatus Acidoferrum typicum]|nr:transcriptional regulator, Crp/Fnr family [Candidatus Acidoferrum typicum]
MTKTSTRKRGKSFLNSGKRSFDGQTIYNAILLDLPRRECENVFAKMELVQTPPRFVLNESAEYIKFVYFVNSGLISILNIMSDGKSVEVGLTGKEGFVGLPVAVGFQTSPTRALTQIAGTAFRVNAKAIENILRECPELEKHLHRYALELALQGAQLAACNRLHEVDERLARWLLMSQDRVGTPNLSLTQESLSMMLGTRRASVTIAAGILQKAGFITYQRGHVKIQSRAGLENAACECYRILNKQLKRWQNNSH